MATALARDGLAIFRGVAGRADAVSLAREVLTIIPHHDAQADGVTVIRDLGGIAARPGCAGFGTGELHPHTEGTALARPPAALMLVCARPATSGGESLLVDAATVHADLSASDAALVAQLSEPSSVLFGGGAGHLGAVFSSGSDGRVVVRFRRDQLVRFHPAISTRLRTLDDVIKRHSVRLFLHRGEGFLVSNTRWLHARTAFDGPRTMHRILGEPHPHLVVPEGFVPLVAAESTTGAAP